MARRSLSQSIFRLVIGIVLATTLTIMVNVWTATTEHAQQRLDRDLKVAQNVLEQVLSNREDLLYNSADVLAADFGFKQAVATHEQGTINSALKNHGQRIGADVMALITLSGTYIASTPENILGHDIFPYQQLIAEVIQNGGAVAMMAFDNRLYQVVMLTVDAPTPIAIALMGFELDLALMQQLKTITGLDTTISMTGHGAERFSVSTLPALAKTTHLIDGSSKLSWTALLKPSVDHFISRQFQMEATADLDILITLSDKAESVFAEFRKLLFNISLIAVTAIVIALILASLLSKRLALPLTLLSRFAQKIAAADYSQKMDTSSNSMEFDYLANALNAMQNNIREREDRISYQAQHDALTTLFNRHHFGEIIDRKLQAGEVLQAVAINIFGFRGINDVFGYQNGDICLRILAERLSTLPGLAARLTGGELLWVPDEPVDMPRIHTVKQMLEKPIETAEVTINLKVAIGLLRCPRDAETAEQLFRRINIILDEAQISRQFVLAYQSELEQRYLRRLSIITELKEVLTAKQNELSLFYQPKLDLQSGQIRAVEALIRWHSSKLGFVPPDDFIAVAESAGLIENVTEWVINRAAEDLSRFQQAGVTINVAINLSAKDLMSPDLAEKIASLLEDKALAHGLLSFEITEGDMVKDVAAAIEQLKLLQVKGFQIAIDDFGTGYSSMAYLQQFPVNVLKIDRAFVMQLDTEGGDQKIVRTIIKLAHSFDLGVVAEGVENRASLSLLQQWGCEMAQGYFIAKPMPADQFIRWFGDNQGKDWLEN